MLLADALYCDYFTIALLHAAGVDVLFEQHGARITTLVTTKLDARQVCKGELLDLYVCRWHVELDIRNIKTTAGLRAALPDPADGAEGAVGVLLAYNVIPLLMAQAAHHAGVHPRELRFKHTVQMWTQWTARTLRADPTQFFRLIAQLSVGSGRGELSLGLARGNSATTDMS